MWCTQSDWMILQSFYDYNRIPVWILNSQGQIIDCFFSVGMIHSKQILKDEMPHTKQMLKDEMPHSKQILKDEMPHTKQILEDEMPHTKQMLTDEMPHTKQILTDHIRHLYTSTQPTEFRLICYENELYYEFTYLYEQESYTVFGGPMLLSGFYHITQMHTLSFAMKLTSKELELLIKNLPVISFTSFGAYLRIIMLLLKKSAPSLEEIRSYPLSAPNGTVTRTLVRELFENTEDCRLHTPYREEVAVLNCVKEGNVAQLESTYRTLPSIKYGKMSNQPLRQLFYGCIANTTLITRYAIEGGLEEETAFTLSDIYINQMEACKTLYELNALNEKMAIDFTKRVAKAKAKSDRQYHKAISACISYIKSNLCTSLSLEQLARFVNLTPKYLSWLFKEETGFTLIAYIDEQKMNEAKNLLQNTNYSCREIGEHLSFHSESYFISRFKKITGMTPAQFRARQSE